MRLLRGCVALCGAAVIAYGVYGLLHDSYIQRPLDVLRWAVAGLVLHDGLWVPLAMLLGTLLTRALPPAAAGPLRGGLLVAAATTAIALPGMLRAHSHPGGNTTVDALAYQHNWALLMLAIAVATVAAAAWRWLRRSR